MVGRKVLRLGLPVGEIAAVAEVLPGRGTHRRALKAGRSPRLGAECLRCLMDALCPALPFALRPSLVLSAVKRKHVPPLRRSAEHTRLHAGRWAEQFEAERAGCARCPRTGSARGVPAVGKYPPFSVPLYLNSNRRSLSQARAQIRISENLRCLLLRVLHLNRVSWEY